MPPVKLLEELRVRLIETIWVRKVTADKWTYPLTPKITYKIKKLEEKARYAIVRQTWEYEFQVEYADTVVAMRLDDRYCDCGYWMLKGVPCLHALACLNYIRDDKKKLYIDLYYHTNTWRMCYLGVIHPIPSQDLWPKFKQSEKLQPPKVIRPPGRPKKTRRRDPMEKVAKRKRLMKPQWVCSRYNQLGHNKRTCTNEPSQKKPKGKPGRPRKKKTSTSGNSESSQVVEFGLISYFNFVLLVAN